MNSRCGSGGGQASRNRVFIDQALAELAATNDKIVVLDNGTVAGVGNHDELMKTNEIYQEIYASQQEGVQE